MQDYSRLIRIPALFAFKSARKGLGRANDGQGKHLGLSKSAWDGERPKPAVACAPI